MELIYLSLAMITVGFSLSILLYKALTSFTILCLLVLIIATGLAMYYFTLISVGGRIVNHEKRISSLEDNNESVRSEVYRLQSLFNEFTLEQAEEEGEHDSN
jgi:hypothetical protein